MQSASLSDASRYELLRDDPRFGLSKGDTLICESMHPAWAPSEEEQRMRRLAHKLMDKVEREASLREADKSASETPTRGRSET